MSKSLRSLDSFSDEELPHNFKEIAERVKKEFPGIDVTYDDYDSSLQLILDKDKYEDSNGKSQAVILRKEGYFSNLSEPGAGNELTTTLQHVLREVKKLDLEDSE